MWLQMASCLLSTCRVLQTVGLLNYKAFLLFLFYTMLAATLATGLLLRSFISFFVQGDEEDLARWAALCRREKPGCASLLDGPDCAVFLTVALVI